MIRLHTRIELTIALIALLAACGSETITDNSVSNNDRDRDSDGCVYLEVAMANKILVGGASSR